ncbi:Methyltransferase type 11 [Thalassoporum mexicanum PCC 7367]|uniref:class I SAM-dependent methyltransferase n=1 Tax=Thalassoporum mexicanum TaxID=3457544 RepID=UPI00029FF3B6|nr:class I SAM-dependent methyltransferase [Pseudanabaena sp. PCC 7367]AFY70973.1 Methyltransferase type 11 [Pseudanabaena sp. PCC 7367]
MGIYSRYIFPALMDWSMSSPEISKYRQQVLAEVSGDVLEIGFGTGLNLPHYPAQVNKLVVVDPNPGMNARAKKRVEAAKIAVESQILNSEVLPMPDRSFDAVVSTWTLCSIVNLEQALSEIARVLKPGGKFYFIEHGLSPEPEVQKWQNRFNPIQKVIGDGCNLNRNISELISRHLRIEKLEEFYMPNTPKIAGYFYQGVAVKD